MSETHYAPRIILAGPPGSGKGTIAPFLVKEFGVHHIAPGDMLRQHKRDGTELGKRAAAFMAKGNLVPVEIVVQMMLDRINEPEVKRAGFVLDGFPRSMEQATAFFDKGVTCTHFIKLEIPDEQVISRMKGRRIDSVTGETYHVTYKPPPADIAD
ncbi:adenylate kinase/UMP-CMP kinase, partial [Kipferlia bialata]|eukprot:g10662.t1